jgi:hypothetical protein
MMNSIVTQFIQVLDELLKIGILISNIFTSLLLSCYSLFGDKIPFTFIMSLNIL